jgi:hypothetical protein
MESTEQTLSLIIHNNKRLICDYHSPEPRLPTINLYHLLGPGLPTSTSITDMVISRGHLMNISF